MGNLMNREEDKIFNKAWELLDDIAEFEDYG